MKSVDHSFIRSSRSIFVNIAVILLVSGLVCSDKSTTVKPPETPSGLTGQALSASSLEIHWTDNSDNEDGFRVFRNAGGEWQMAVSVSANQVSIIDSLLQELTLYSYYVIAFNGSGQSGSTDTIVVSTLGVGDAPEAPTSLYPNDEAENVPVITLLVWACADPDGDSLSYEVYLGQGSYLSKIDSNLAVRHCQPGRLLYDTRYNWRVVARDDHHHATPGPVWHFTTVSNAPPGPPSMPSPPDNAPGIGLDVVLSWDCGDPDGDSLLYDVYLGPGTDRRLVASNLEESRIAPESLTYSTEYTWRVAAKDTFDNETMGPIWAFTTADTSYMLTTLIQGMGSIIMTPDSAHYQYGDIVILQAIPEAGWYFSGWSGDASGRANPIEVVIEGNMTIIGHFSQGIPPAWISGTVSWPGHALSPRTNVFADSLLPDRLAMMAQAHVDQNTGTYTIMLDSLPRPIRVKIEAHDDVNNSGVWNPIDAGDGWWFYDQNSDSLWNDFITISPGDEIMGADIVLRLVE